MSNTSDMQRTMETVRAHTRPSPAPAGATQPAGIPLDLHDLAALAAAETAKRSAGLENLVANSANVQTALQRAQGQASLEAGDRSRSLSRDQMAQAAALRSEEIRARAAEAAAQRRLQADLSGGDFMFKLGQARAAAAAEAAAAEEEEDAYTLSDFGSQAINSEVGRILSEDPAIQDRLRATDAALNIAGGPGSDLPDWAGDYDSALDIYQNFVADPQNPAQVVEQMRALYGGDRDLAALALYNLGFFDTVGATQPAG